MSDVICEVAGMVRQVSVDNVKAAATVSQHPDTRRLPAAEAVRDAAAEGVCIYTVCVCSVIRVTFADAVKCCCCCCCRSTRRYVSRARCEKLHRDHWRCCALPCNLSPRALDQLHIIRTVMPPALRKGH